MLTATNWENGYPAKIVVLRALMLGDLLCMVPALRALKARWPQSRVTLIGLPWARSFAWRFNCYIDDFIDFPGFPGLPETKLHVNHIPRFIKSVQEENFDLALQMHGSGSFVNTLIMLFGAKVNAGFCEPDFCPDRHYFMPFPRETHEIHVFLRLMEFLGIPQQGDDLEFLFLDEDNEEFQRLSRRFYLEPKNYICIHPGARLLTRRWPVENFASVANRLGDQGWTIVLTGAADEEGIVNELSSRMHHFHINLVGKTSLGSLALLLKNATLLVSNDTGVSHIASAVNTPSVIVVSGSDPVRWAPLNSDLHKTVLHPVDCRPCFDTYCPFDLKCGRGVQPEQVENQAQTLLKQKVSDEKTIADPHMACPR